MKKATDVTWFEVNGAPLRARVSGPVDAPPVLLVHGIARSLEDWTEVQDLLAVDHRVISTDLPGFGYSPRGRGRPGLPVFARSMVELLEAAGVPGPAHVVGNSLGGAVAMTMAVEHPGRVASLTLANSVGFGREVNIPVLPIVYGALGVMPGLRGTFGPRALEAGNDAVRDLFFDRTIPTPEHFDHVTTLAMQRDFIGTFLGTAFTLGAPLVGVWPGWRRELLPKVTATGVPALVVWGDADNLLPVKHLQAAAAALPGARTHVFADTGHMPMFEKAAEFAEVTAAFVAEVSQVEPDVGSVPA